MLPSLDEIRALLASETSWQTLRDGVESGLDDERPLNALRDVWEEYCDERARTLSQILTLERDAHEQLVRAVLAVRAELEHGPESRPEPRVWWGNLQDAIEALDAALARCGS